MADLTSNQICNICRIHYNVGLRCVDLGTDLTSTQGGWLFAKDGSSAWIVAPNAYTVSRSWYCRNDAVTLANDAFGSGDWFVPNLSELLYASNYKEFWDTYSTSTTSHWSSSACGTTNASSSWSVVVCRSCSCGTFNNNARTVRAFRRVFY